MRLSMHSD